MCANDQAKVALPVDQLFEDSGPDMVQTCRALEALLFVATEPLNKKTLSQILSITPAQVDEAMIVLEQQYQGRGLILRMVAGGWQLVTAPEFSSLVQKLYRPKFQQLSAAAMETLAIIAYRQPITRAEISQIRHVDCDGVVGTLLEKGLICEKGRLEGAGRAILYGTSPDFLEFFGINSLSELPPLDIEEDDTLMTV